MGSSTALKYRPAVVVLRYFPLPAAVDFLCRLHARPEAVALVCKLHVQPTALSLMCRLRSSFTSHVDPLL